MQLDYRGLKTADFISRFYAYSTRLIRPCLFNLDKVLFPQEIRTFKGRFVDFE